ncbi:hypothetical protein CBL_13753 [Carabus blaptoides fortunei]
MAIRDIKYVKQTGKIIGEELQSNCIKPVQSPLKTLSANASNAKHSVRLFDDDLFNSQLKKVDINLSKDNDQSLFTEDSFEEYDTIKSPTFNKSKKNRSIKKAKRNNN